MYVVGMGLVKVYKALIRLASGGLSVPFLMSMSEASSVPFYTLIIILYYYTLIIYFIIFIKVYKNIL